MTFKNASVFRITSDWQPGEELEELLGNYPFIPCSGLRPSSFGWVPPVHGQDSLCHEVAGCTIICGKHEQKVVPASCLQELLIEKITRWEELEGRPVRAKEKQRLKEDALAELLPKALPKSKLIFGYIDEGVVVINTTTDNDSEVFIHALRASVDEKLGMMPPQVGAKPSDKFTHWLHSRKLPDNFYLGQNCDLFDPEDNSKVTCRDQDLSTQEVRSHLDAGKVCRKLSLVYNGDMQFTVDRNLIISQIKNLTNSSDDNPGDDEDEISLFEAAFTDFSLQLKRMLPDLLRAMDGEQIWLM